MFEHLKNRQGNSESLRRRLLGFGARILYLPLFILSLVLSLSGLPREAGALSTFDKAVMQKVFQPWKGGLCITKTSFRSNFSL